MAALKKLEERLKLVESAIEAVNARMTSVEARLESVASKQISIDVDFEDKIKEAVSESESKLVSSELRCEQKFTDIGKQLQEVTDKATAIELRISELSEEWPTVQEAWKDVGKTRKNIDTAVNDKKVRKQSFAEKFKDRASDTVVIIGDSLVRGVGAKLEQQSNMYTAASRGGARIENVTEEISQMKDKEDRHLVVLVGTNNVQKEGSVEIIEKYKTLIEVSKRIKSRKISICGIPRRVDLTSYQNSRRLGVNQQLKEICTKNDVEYIEYEPQNSRLARDGLHLNYLGQDELAGRIFSHCKTFLV